METQTSPVSKELHALEGPRAGQAVFYGVVVWGFCSQSFRSVSEMEERKSHKTTNKTCYI